MVYHIWYMVYGIWYIVYGIWYMELAGDVTSGRILMFHVSIEPY